MVRLLNSLVLEGHSGVVWCVSWNNSGKTLASCGEDRTIKLWNANGKQTRLIWSYLLMTLLGFIDIAALKNYIILQSFWAYCDAAEFVI